jgi:light-regulated signal transduction histidine kinase (bacteriophytochrome)
LREYSRRLTECCDELVLNSIFNANPRLRLMDRRLPYVLNREESVRVSWSWHDLTFALKVQDSFGTLQRSDFFGHLLETKRKQRMSDSHSAGLGLRLVQERVHHLHAHVVPGVRTEVAFWVTFSQNWCDLEKRSRSLHFHISEAPQTVEESA